MTIFIFVIEMVMQLNFLKIAKDLTVILIVTFWTYL